MARDSKAITTALQDYDVALDQYIPVLMMQAKAYWDKANYA